MNLQDVVVAPGQTARFVVSIDREYLKPSVVGADVSVWVDGNGLGHAVTDGDGTATIVAKIDGRPTAYQAQSIIDGKRIRGKGRIFHWDPSRTGVAVDLDDTISHTNYSDLFITRFDTRSPPFEQSPQALQVMARNYQLVYVSARPRWLLEKSRAWLDHNRFPPGPILHAPGFEGCFHQGYYKERMIAEFQKEFPNLLAGVGDKMEDDRAYWNRRMLAVILETSERRFRNHCIVVPNWQEVGEFFQKYSDKLSAANSLSELIQTSNMNLRPMFEHSESTASIASN